MSLVAVTYSQPSLPVLCWCTADVNLWEEQIPPDTLVVLSGRDALMAAPQVRLACAGWQEAQHTWRKCARPGRQHRAVR